MEEMWRMESVVRAERGIILERNEDAIVALGNNVVDKTYEDLPEQVREAAKKDVLNITGCMLAGTCMRQRDMMDQRRRISQAHDIILNHGWKRRRKKRSSEADVDQ